MILIPGLGVETGDKSQRGVAVRALDGPRCAGSSGGVGFAGVGGQGRHTL